MNNIQNNISNQEEYTIKEIFSILSGLKNYFYSKLRLILFVVVFGSLIGLIIAIYDIPTYTAKLTFAMEEDKGGGSSGGLTGALGIASSLGIDLGSSGGGVFAGTNISELMRSRYIVEKTLLLPIKTRLGDSISLADYYLKIYGYDVRWKNNPSLKNLSFPYTESRSDFKIIQDSVLFLLFKKIVSDNLSIFQKDKKVSIVTIEVNSVDQLFSKIFCENIATQTSRFYIETKIKKSKTNVEIMQKQADSIKKELDNSIMGVAAAADNVYNLNPAFLIKGTQSKKKQIEIQANSAIMTQLLAQLEIAKVNLRKETPLIQIIDKPILPLEKDKLGKLKTLILGGSISSILIILILSLFYSFKKFNGNL